MVLNYRYLHLVILGDQYVLIMIIQDYDSYNDALWGIVSCVWAHFWHIAAIVSLFACVESLHRVGVYLLDFAAFCQCRIMATREGRCINFVHNYYMWSCQVWRWSKDVLSRTVISLVSCPALQYEIVNSMPWRSSWNRDGSLPKLLTLCCGDLTKIAQPKSRQYPAKIAMVAFRNC